MKKIYLVVGLLMAVSSFSYAQLFDNVQKIVAPDRMASSEMGYAVAIKGNTAVVGARSDKTDENGLNPMSSTGAAYIYEKNASGMWVFTQKLVAPDRRNGDFFGYSVDVDGDYLVVGSEVNDTDENGVNIISNAGAAYVFEKNTSGIWVLKQKLVDQFRTPSEYYGHMVCVKGDFIAIGSPLENHDANNTNSVTAAGAVFIYQRDASGIWNLDQKITHAVRESYDYFGFSVSLDQDEVIVGAMLEDHDENGLNPLSSAGSAFVFQRQPTGQWLMTQKVVPPDRYTSDYFARSVSLSGDMMVIGSENDYSNTSGGGYINQSGSAYIYEKNQSGTWLLKQKIIASDRDVNDNFSYYISMSGDYIIAGAFTEDHDENGSNSLNNAGAAYLFKKGPSGTWTEIQKIVGSDRFGNDQFGWSVDIDNGNAIVGAFLHDYDENGGNFMSTSGATYIFNAPAANNVEWTGNTSNDWHVASNWDIGQVPHIESNVLIPATPAGGQFPGQFSDDIALCKNLDLQSGAHIFVPSGKTLDVSSNINVGADAYITNNGIWGASGLVSVSQLIPQGAYHYLSSPFSNLPLTEFIDDISVIPGNPYVANDTNQTTVPFPNFFHYDESFAFSTISLGWDHPGTNLSPLKGYAVNTGVIGSPVNLDYIQSGADLNTGPQSIAVSNTPSGSPASDGWNLVGNPYLSPIDWDASSGWTKTNVNNSIYFFTPTSQYGGVYASYVNGIGTPLGTTGIIAPMQGFFVKASGNGSLAMDNSVQVTASAPFYKSVSADPIIRLGAYKLNNPLSADETVVYFTQSASQDFSGQEDSEKLFSSDPLIPRLYTRLGNNNYTINALPSLGNSGRSIPLRLSVAQAGTYNIDLIQFENIPSGYELFLEDLVLNTIINLSKQGYYSCSCIPDDTDDRFILHLNPQITGIEDFNPVNAWAYSFEDQLYVHHNAVENASFELFALSGERLMGYTDIPAGKHQYNISKLSRGIFILSLSAGETTRSIKIRR